MPVREALRMLQRDGLISFANYRGATVVKLSMQRAAEIVSVRMHLEVLGILNAVPHHTPDTVAELTELLERMDRQAQARQAQRFTETNRRFHGALYAPGRNDVLKEEIEVLWDRVWRARPRSIFALDPMRMQAAQTEHRAIVEAIRKGDPARAAEAMSGHRTNTLGSWRDIGSKTENSE